MAAAAGGSSPVRMVSMDKRLENMPDDLDKEQKSKFIKEACKLKDAMYELVHVLRRAGVSWLALSFI